VLFSTDMLTLPAGLAQLQNENTTRFDLLMAGGVIASVPVLAVYVLAQRYIIEGVSQGGVKG
jgi:multiple sugar transport system permease protein